MLAAFAANIGIAVIKFVAFVITGSASMLAESVHSVADSGNQALLLLGRRRAQREETEQHQFGFGAERYFYGFIVALVLFIVGAVFSLYEGVQRILHPEHLTSPAVALAVLGVAAVLESLSFRTAIRESHQAKGPHLWRGFVRFIRRAKAPEIPAVLLEDTAALAGLVFALVAVALTTITGNPRWDGAGSLGIGVLLGFVAAILATETKSLLIGESATADVERAIVAALEDGLEVERVIHLRTLHLGPETLLVAAKIAIRGDQSAADLVAGIDRAERRVRAAVPIAELIYLEPDLYQDSRADPTDPAIRAARRSPLRAAGRSAVRAVRRSWTS
ncbi:MAG TPA: cation diffusion facilitator family transporter [Streptosporangiaceae bacterium]|nr:cation diffusion facilitator family transporter [Streptosporangiaceae bacterium]